jgi:hypothetical protein
MTDALVRDLSRHASASLPSENHLSDVSSSCLATHHPDAVFLPLIILTHAYIPITSSDQGCVRVAAIEPRTGCTGARLLRFDSMCLGGPIYGAGRLRTLLEMT